MLRETSEMAAAMSVRSAPSKPSSAASKRPFLRAVTMSASDVIGTRASFGVMRSPLGFSIQIGQPFLEVQGGADAFERQPQLHHRKGDLGLDADDDGFGAAQL